MPKLGDMMSITAFSVTLLLTAICIQPPIDKRLPAICEGIWICKSITEVQNKERITTVPQPKTYLIFNGNKCIMTSGDVVICDSNYESKNELTNGYKVDFKVESGAVKKAGKDLLLSRIYIRNDKIYLLTFKKEHDRARPENENDTFDDLRIMEYARCKE